ncbi:MAG: hypothetical protein ABI036_15220 [Fibrobacteria bacterium]
MKPASALAKILRPIFSGGPVAFLRPAFLLCLLLPAMLALTRCAPRPKASHPEKKATVKDLDSLNQVAEHKDSVESNHFFYEEAYAEYRARYPGVDKAAYLKIAKGKDQEFCLFKPNPVQTCLDNGDRFNDLNLKEPARDAYQAGLLSEGSNETRQNIRLWASMGQLAFDFKQYEEARIHLLKVLEVEPKNKWAKKLLGSLPK